MYIKPYTIYHLHLNSDEVETLQQVCAKALSSPNYATQYTASQIVEELFSGEEDGYSDITIIDGMVKRYNAMIREISPDLLEMYSIPEGEK